MFNLSDGVKKALILIPTQLLPARSRVELHAERVVAAVERIITSHSGENVAVVCHGGVINTYVAHVLGLDADPPGFFYPNYTSIHRVAASRSGVRSLVTLNETSFLRGSGLPMGLVQKG